MRIRAAVAAVVGCVAAVGLSGVAGAAGATAPAGPGVCIAHRFPYEAPVRYTAGCTGHDEPELDPVSSHPGSARDITWTAVLPTDGVHQVVSVGPTFWWGGTVRDPKSLFGQAFLEVQFYPDSRLTRCAPNGSFFVQPAPNVYTICTPVWSLKKQGGHYIEPAAFNAMITDGTSSRPLVLHGGDRVAIHIWAPSLRDPYRVQVTDRSTGRSGGVTLLSPTDGPLTPAYDRQQVGNQLGWGAVQDTPMSFVWEIGHTGNFTTPPGQFCLPGQLICDSYDAAHWAGFTPLQIQGVHFGDGSHPQAWATVSDFGGAAEVARAKGCRRYGEPYCIYPWYTRGATSFRYGVDYPGTVRDFGKAAQFATMPACAGGFGPRTTYCSTEILSTPFGG